MSYTKAPKYVPHPIFELDPKNIQMETVALADKAMTAYLKSLDIETDDGEDAKAPLVIYHENCLDGMTAALMAWKGMEGLCILLPWNYNKGLPSAEVFMYRPVYTVDFSFVGEDLKELALYAATLTMIDHHEDQCNQVLRQLEEDPSLLDTVNCYFNSDRSGAFLSWKTFIYDMALVMEDEHLPPMVAYVQDRDLWKFELVNTKAYCEALAQIPKDINSYFQASCLNLSQLIDIGEAMLQSKRKKVEEYAAKAYIQNPGGRCIVNAPLDLASDLGEYLYRHFPIKYAAIYSFNEKTGSVQVSLRSNPEVCDCSEIARRYGGNGHKGAAGFIISDNAFLLLRDNLPFCMEPENETE